MQHRVSRFLPALVSLPLFAALAGGWAVVTVDQLPDYLVAGTPVTLSFKVRQHGVSLLNDLRPTLEARSGGQLARTAAAPGKEAGQYVASFTPAQAGDWTITIHSGFGPTKLTLPPIRALAAGSGPGVALTETERGKRLFVGKGCVICHVRGDVQEEGTVNAGPELTGQRWPTDYLAKFLANPAIVPPRQGSTGMPNLGLKPAEITALSAYLNLP